MWFVWNEKTCSWDTLKKRSVLYGDLNYAKFYSIEYIYTQFHDGRKLVVNMNKGLAIQYMTKKVFYIAHMKNHKGSIRSTHWITSQYKPVLSPQNNSLLTNVHINGTLNEFDIFDEKTKQHYKVERVGYRWVFKNFRGNKVFLYTPTIHSLMHNYFF